MEPKTACSDDHATTFTRRKDRYAAMLTRIKGLLPPGLTKNNQLVVAQLVENQREAGKLSQDAMSDDYCDVVLNAVPRLLALDLCSAQPLVDRQGKVYFLKFMYSKSKVDLAGGDLPEVNLVVDSFDVVNDLISLDITADDYELDVRAVSDRIVKKLNDDLVVQLWEVADDNSISWSSDPEFTRQENCEALFIKVMERSNVIHRRTMRGGANKIVVDRKTYDTYMKDFSFWESSLRYKVQVHDDWNERGMLLAYVGDSYLDAGAFYTPDEFLLKVFSGDSDNHVYDYRTSGGVTLAPDGHKFYGKILIND